MWYAIRKKNDPDQFVSDNGGYGPLSDAYILTEIPAPVHPRPGPPLKQEEPRGD